MDLLYLKRQHITACLELVCSERVLKFTLGKPYLGRRETCIKLNLLRDQEKSQEQIIKKIK